MIFVAVYGTLKKGFRNHPRLAQGQSKFVETSHTGSGFSLFVDSLPFLTRRASGTGCQIEIYEVSPETLESLDQLEGHPDFYRREILCYREDYPVWIYILNKDWFDSTPDSEAIDSYQE